MVDDDEQPHSGQPVGKRDAAVIDGADLATLLGSQHDAIPLQLAAHTRLAEVVDEGTCDRPGEAAPEFREGLFRADRVVGQDGRQLRNQPCEIFFLGCETLYLAPLTRKFVLQGRQQFAALLLRLFDAVELARLLVRKLCETGLFGGDLSSELGELADARANAAYIAGAMIVQLTVIGHPPAD
jgi:hypothetical protein